MKDAILNLTKQYAQSTFYKPFVPGKTYIHASGAKLYPDDVAQLVECALSGWYTEWTYANKFKKALASVFGAGISDTPKVTLCNSGSSASLLALTAAIQQSKKPKAPYVITCATGFPTTVSPIYQNGKVPYYVDIDPITLCPKIEDIKYVFDKYGDDVCGMIFAHTLGFPFDEQLFSRLAQDNDVFFIVDMCDALGSELLYDGREFSVGLFADYATLSFFPAHQICSGEGGAVITWTEQDHKLVESLCSWSRSCYCKPGQDNTCGHRFDWEDRGKLPKGWDHKYIFDTLGYNLKMTDLQAALGASQMTHLEEFVIDRRNNFRYLFDSLNRYEWLSFVEIPACVRPSPFGFPITVSPDAPFTANEMIAYLEEHKVGTRRLFGGNLTRQPGFMNLPYAKTDLEGSDFVMHNLFWIACAPFLTQEMLDYMVSVIDKFMEKYK